MSKQIFRIPGEPLLDLVSHGRGGPHGAGGRLTPAQVEQKINAHPKLTDEEKVHMQQYVTGCYGTLTTFNVLVGAKGGQFEGQAEKD